MASVTRRSTDVFDSALIESKPRQTPRRKQGFVATINEMKGVIPPMSQIGDLQPPAFSNQAPPAVAPVYARGNGAAIAGMTIGIVGIALGMFVPFLTLVLIRINVETYIHVWQGLIIILELLIAVVAGGLALGLGIAGWRRARMLPPPIAHWVPAVVAITLGTILLANAVFNLVYSAFGRILGQIG